MCLFPGTSPFDMTASVTNPSGITELCDIVSLDDNHYSIKFVPKEMGVHTVSVKHKDMHIPGKFLWSDCNLDLINLLYFKVSIYNINYCFYEINESKIIF